MPINLLTCGDLCNQLAAHLQFYSAADGSIHLDCDGTSLGVIPSAVLPPPVERKCYETCSFIPSPNADQQTVNVWNGVGNEGATLTGAANFNTTDANGNPWRTTPAPTTTVDAGATNYVYQFNTTTPQLATVEGYVTVPPGECFCPNLTSIRFRQSSAGAGRYMWYASPDANPDNAAIVGAQHANNTNSAILTVPLDPDNPTTFWQRHYLANNTLDATVRLQYTLNGTTWINVPDEWYSTTPDATSEKVTWSGPVGGPFTGSDGTTKTLAELNAVCAIEVNCWA